MPVDKKLLLEQLQTALDFYALKVAPTDDEEAHAQFNMRALAAVGSVSGLQSPYAKQAQRWVDTFGLFKTRMAKLT